MKKNAGRTDPKSGRHPMIVKKNLLSFTFSLCFVVFAPGQSQEQVWGIMDGIPVHFDLDGQHFTRISGDTTGTGRQASEVHLGNDGYLYGTSTYNQTDTRLIYKIHKDSAVLHPVIKLKYGARILSIAIDEQSVIFGSALDQITSEHFVFKVDNDGKNYRILHHFPGEEYVKEVIVDEEYVYGIQGVGVSGESLSVFKISKADAAYHTLATVQGGPATPLLLTSNDELVWITSGRYSFNQKQIYKINKDGSDFGVLGYFNTEAPDINSLIQTRDGKIFGAYTAAGYPSVRYIFRLDTSRFGFAEQIQIQDNSWIPGGTFIELPDGRLVSESYYGSILLYFSPNDNSQHYSPTGNLGNLRAVAPDGKVFGMVGDGSTYTPPAGFYTANIDGSGFKVLHTFGINDVGSNTSSLLQAPDGNIYGTNQLGGANTNGTVFKINPEGISKVWDNGELSVGALYANTDGYLYTHNTSLPGCRSLTLFRFKTNGEGLEKACVRQSPFDYSGPIQLSTGEMVGVSRVGGGNGFMYRMKPNLGGLEVLKSFSRETGNRPVSIMEGINGYLYGIHLSGGVSNVGGVFRVKPDGTDYKILVQFDGKNGWSTSTNLVQHKDGTLYGVMPTRAPSRKGYIFSLQPDGSDYKVAIDFTSPELAGISPQESLLMDESGRLYNNGSRGNEVFVYAVDTDGQEFQKIVSGAVELSFIKKSLEPALVKAIQPADKAVDLPVKMTLQVSPVQYAETYSLQLSKRSDFSTIELSQTSATPSIEIAGLEYGATYFARVQTNLWPAFGPVTRFRTMSAETCADIGCFTLVNADTDEDIESIEEGETFVKPVNSYFNVRFNAVYDPGSVEFRIGDNLYRVENAPPFSLAGDFNGDYLPWKAGLAGTYSIEATPYTGPNRTGIRGNSVSISFTIIQPEITAAGFTIVNADTDEDIQPLNEGDIFVKRSGTQINIRYDAINNPGSVVFKHQNKVVRTENAAPFALRGDRSGNYLPWAGAVAGNHRIDAIPYSLDRGLGTAGTPLTVNFTIVEEGDLAMASRETEPGPINVYPNPARSGQTELTIVGHRSKDQTETLVEIINITGDVIFSEKINCEGDCDSYAVQVKKNLLPGIYMVRIKNNGNRVLKRLLIN